MIAIYFRRFFKLFNALTMKTNFKSKSKPKPKLDFKFISQLRLIFFIILPIIILAFEVEKVFSYSLQTNFPTNSFMFQGFSINQKDNNYSQNHQNSNNQNSNNQKKSKITTLRGKLIFKEIPPVMSMEAYNGEEFFLIPNSANQQVNKNKNPIVLRPSAKVSETQLKNFQNQRVEIKAEYTQGTRPSASTTPCPVDINGQCLPQGAGYHVFSIKGI
jgi:hypothetical protein